MNFKESQNLAEKSLSFAASGFVPRFAKAALGNNRKSCALQTPEIGKISTINNDISKRNQAFKLQKLSADSLKDTTFRNGNKAGVCSCCKHRNGSGKAISVKYDFSKNKASFANLFRCNSVWLCPVCAKRVSEVRRDELLTVSEKWQSGDFFNFATRFNTKINLNNSNFEKKNSIFLVTFTVKHKRSDSLIDVLNALKHGFHSLSRNKSGRNLLAKYGIAHNVRSLEVTYGNSNGWHPHYHCLFYSFFNLNKDEIKAFRDELSIEWQKIFKDELEPFKPDIVHGVHIADGSFASTYINKFGEEVPCRRLGKKVDLEMTKSHMKKAKEKDRFSPFEMLEYFDDLPYLIPKYIEYAKAFFASRQLKYSQGLKRLMGLVDLTDEQVLDDLDAIEDSETREIFNVNSALFDILYINNLRGEFLAMVEMDLKNNPNQDLKNTNRFVNSALTRVFDKLEIALNKTNRDDEERIRRIQNRITSCINILQNPLGVIQFS